MAGQYAIACDQGATLRRVITWMTSGATPAVVDLTGFTARMQVREQVTSEDVVLELTTENDRIILGDTAGTITILVDAATMADITAGSYRYDLELVSGSEEVTRLVEGKFSVKAEVTR